MVLNARPSQDKRGGVLAQDEILLHTLLEWLEKVESDDVETKGSVL